MAEERVSRRHALVMLLLTPPLLFGLSTSSGQLANGARKAGQIRLAMLSFWHVHATDYLHQALANHSTQVAAVWDEEPARGQAQARTLGVPFYAQLADLLAHADVDGVIVDAPTTMHRNVMVAAAQAGKHIFTEKVLAPTLHECNEIIAAVDKAGVVLTVSLPRLYAGSTLAIKNILEQQLLGDVTQVRIRVAHDGALRTALHPQGWLPPYFFDPKQTAGGAMIDLGCHPMYLARYFLGMPEYVNATYGYVTGRAVEDNAVVTLGYSQGAIGVVETGFVNPFSPFTIEAHGTKGSLLYGTPDSIIRLRSTLAGLSGGEQWHTWTAIPPDQPTAFQQWITHIQQGTTMSENRQIALDLSRLMETANLAAMTQQAVSLQNLKR